MSSLSMFMLSCSVFFTLFWCSKQSRACEKASLYTSSTLITSGSHEPIFTQRKAEICALSEAFSKRYIFVLQHSHLSSLKLIVSLSCVIHTSPNARLTLSEIRHAGVCEWPLSSVWLAHRPWCCYFMTCWCSISVLAAAVVLNLLLWLALDLTGKGDFVENVPWYFCIPQSVARLKSSICSECKRF